MLFFANQIKSMRSKRRPNNSNHGLLKKQVRKTVRKYFIDEYGVDPPVINGDQMPLHRNESATQKTLFFEVGLSPSKNFFYYLLQ